MSYQDISSPPSLSQTLFITFLANSHGKGTEKERKIQLKDEDVTMDRRKGYMF